MSNGTFPINMRDIKFILYEQLGIERLCQFEKFKDYSRETFDMVLEEGAKIATEVIAPLNSISDKEGCTYEKGKVKVPEGFHEAFKKYCEGGWIAASVDAEAGGQGLPDSIALATAEMFVSACCSFTTYPGLTRGCANLIESFGTPEQKALYLEKMYSGQWTGTMCLTEPQAGSAVGDVKSMAKKEGDHYLIQGTKIFITAGDHNLTENIIHAVLARTENAPAGIKGLSLFIVPKVRVNADGSLGDAERRQLRRHRAQDGAEGFRHRHPEFRRRREMPGLYPRPGRAGDPAHVPDDERSPFGSGPAGISPWATPPICMP